MSSRKGQVPPCSQISTRSTEKDLDYIKGGTLEEPEGEDKKSKEETGNSDWRAKGTIEHRK